MPPGHLELQARRFGIREGLSDSLTHSLPGGCRDDPAAAACVSQWMVFWMGRNSGHSLGLGWPGRAWQGYSSLGVLEGMTSEEEACHSSKIV